MEVFKLFGSILIDNTAANNSLKKTDEQATSSGNKMVSMFKKIGGAMIAGFSIQKIKEFGAECTEAYKVQAEAEKKLETVMKQRMGASDKSIQSVKDFTSAQQKLGVVGDEVQLAGAQQLATFLKTDGALKTLIPAMNNLAVQQNGVNVSSGNMVSLGNLMGKVMNGSTSALTKVGISFSEAEEKVLKYGTEEERAAMLAQVITNNVGNMNEEIAKTDDGKQQQYKNTLGDLKEVIGQRLIPVQTVYYGVLAQIGTFLVNILLPVIDSVSSMFTKFTNSITSNTDVSKKFNDLWNGLGIPIFNALKQAGETLYNSFNIVWPSIQKLISNMFDAFKTVWNGVGVPIFSFISFCVVQLFGIFSQYFPVIANIVKDAFDIINRVYTNIFKPIINAIMILIRDVLLPIWTVQFGIFSGTVKNTFEYISRLWNGTLKPILNGIIDFITGVFTGNWSQAFNGLKSIAKGIFEGIKTVITAPIEKAKNIIGGIIDSIKGFFNFKITWPKIPLPHFALKPKGWEIGDLLKGKIPSLGIDWYAKAMDDGMVLEKPTIFGAAGGKLLGAGEAGSETVVGTKSLMNMINEASTSGNKELLQVLHQIKDYLADEDRWYRIMLKALADGSLAIILDGREVGRVIRKYA